MVADSDMFDTVMITNSIDTFFLHPSSKPDDNIYSTLYLLRRDILTSFNINPTDKSPLNHQALFLGTMGICAGIDLLSKLYYTDVDKRGNYSGDRFRKYVKLYIDSENSEVLYQLRNSLLHSYGLYSIDWERNEYHFVLNENSLNLVTNSSTDVYSINIRLLLEAFEISIVKFEYDVRNDEQRKKNFNLMLKNYGFIGIGNK